jgi:hypothetical protein
MQDSVAVAAFWLDLLRKEMVWTHKFGGLGLSIFAGSNPGMLVYEDFLISFRIAPRYERAQQ